MLEINSKNIKIWSMLGHRGAFAVALLDLLLTERNLMVLTADLGSLSGLERVKSSYPGHYLNVGIAEQNMIGIAAGLAKEGCLVYATTYSNFLAMRSYEQVRINLGYMGFPVHLVGTGSGIAMGMSGNSHYGLEDIALMRAVPGLTVLSPADGAEIIKTIQAVKDYKRPTYIRLTGGMNNPVVYSQEYDFQIGKSVTLCDGGDVSIIATGTMVYESLVASQILRESHIDAAVVNMHTIKPLDSTVLEKACKSSKLIVTVEEHGIVGGLGGAVAEYKSGIANAPRQLFIGLPDKFGKIGDYRFLLQKYGLTGIQIAQQIKNFL